MFPASWTDEDIELLKVMIAKGWSAGQMSKAFNHRFSRNAVIGKVHRLKLKVAGAPGGRRAPKKGAGSIPLPVAAPVAQEPIGAAGELLTKGCRYIIGELADGGRMCGHVVNHKRVQYCDYHASVCLVKPPKAGKHGTKNIRTSGLAQERLPTGRSSQGF